MMPIVQKFVQLFLIMLISLGKVKSKCSFIEHRVSSLSHEIDQKGPIMKFILRQGEVIYYFKFLKASFNG